MNQNLPQTPGSPLPDLQTPAGGYTFAAPPPAGSIDAPNDPHSEPKAPQMHQANMPIPPIIATSSNVADSDDTEEVDEAWLEKTCEIIERTREDPYLQTKALAALRADFLKSRYSKDSKISEEPAK